LLLAEVDAKFVLIRRHAALLVHRPTRKPCSRSRRCNSGR
jgi:hypothetical protein